MYSVGLSSAVGRRRSTSTRPGVLASIRAPGPSVMPAPSQDQDFAGDVALEVTEELHHLRALDASGVI